MISIQILFYANTNQVYFKWKRVDPKQQDQVMDEHT